VTTLTILDRTPPVFLGHYATQVGPDLLRLEVNCSDAYGVESMSATYREQGYPSSSTDPMMLVSGDSTNGTWAVTVRLVSPNVVEYNFTAVDTGQSVTDPPAGGNYDFTPVDVSEFPLVAVVIMAAALMVVVAAVSRARRS
jgi:hypothetical protein